MAAKREATNPRLKYGFIPHRNNKQTHKSRSEANITGHNRPSEAPMSNINFPWQLLSFVRETLGRQLVGQSYEFQHR